MTGTRSVPRTIQSFGGVVSSYILCKLYVQQSDSKQLFAVFIFSEGWPRDQSQHNNSHTDFEACIAIGGGSKAQWIGSYLQLLLQVEKLVSKTLVHTSDIIILNVMKQGLLIHVAKIHKWKHMAADRVGICEGHLLVPMQVIGLVPSGVFVGILDIFYACMFWWKIVLQSFGFKK